MEYADEFYLSEGLLISYVLCYFFPFHAFSSFIFLFKFDFSHFFLLLSRPFDPSMHSIIYIMHIFVIGLD